MKNPYRGIDTVIFDLDGTLLDTLGDLAAAVNYALRQAGMPEREVTDIRRFLGDGIRRLMQRAVPEGTDEAHFEPVFETFRRYYMAHCLDRTRPYDGIPRLLRALRACGYALAIVSNKLQPAVTALCERFFSDTVGVAIGERPGLRRKPAPDMVMEALRELGRPRETAIYAGDSEVDLETARGAGLPCISVLWGFRDRAFLESLHAAPLAERPDDILTLLRGA